MKRIAGYRSRDRDDIQFIETGEGGDPSADLVLMIEPEQLVLVGDVDLEAPGSVRRSQSGEWGRIGPTRSAIDSTEPTPDAVDAGSRPIDGESTD